MEVQQKWVGPDKVEALSSAYSKIAPRQESNGPNSPPISHMWRDTFHIWQYYDLGQCAIALSRLENALPRVLKHLTYSNTLT